MTATLSVRLTPRASHCPRDSANCRSFCQMSYSFYLEPAKCPIHFSMSRTLSYYFSAEQDIVKTVYKHLEMVQRCSFQAHGSQLRWNEHCREQKTDSVFFPLPVSSFFFCTDAPLHRQQFCCEPFVSVESHQHQTDEYEKKIFTNVTSISDG